MAMVSNSGLARSIRPIHGLFDGDVVFGMATTTPPSPELSRRELQAVYGAAADALGRAVVHALVDGGVYCERYPSACRKRGDQGRESPGGS
jgi:L-aminopeptidase/D-esterase-like protein